MAAPMLGMGPAIRSAADELSRYRWHVWLDFIKELKSQTSGTYAGWLWPVFLPLVPVILYLGLGFLRVFPVTEGVHSMVYVTLGATLWLLFSSLVMTTTNGLTSKGAAASSSGYPLIALVASNSCLAALEFLIRLIFCIVVMAVVQPPDALGLLLSLPFLALGIMLFSGAGMIVGLYTIALTDLQRAVPVMLQYGFFLSYVLFPLPVFWVTDVIYVINPFAVFLDNIRHLVATGQLVSPLPLLVWSVIAVLVAVIGLRFFKNAESHVREYL